MPKRKQSYEMLEDVVEAIKHSPDEFMHVLKPQKRWLKQLRII